MFSQGTPETRQGCPMPPYNTLNFTTANPTIFSTLTSYAANAPNYPLPVGSNARQVSENQANVSYFNFINQQTLVARSTVKSGATNLAYPKFQTESQRLQYRQGLATTAARTYLSGANPAVPMGVPLSTNYQIINN
jgi:hypothetical protein